MKKILLISDSSSIHTLRWIKALEFYKIYLFDWRLIDESLYDNLKNVVIVKQNRILKYNLKFASFIVSYISVKKIETIFLLTLYIRTMRLAMVF